MHLAKRGVTRWVFVFKNVVIKVPKAKIWNHFLRGLLSNITERQTWRFNSGKYEEGRSYLLCPVLWCSWGGWILVMKRARLITKEEWDSIPDIGLYKKYFGGDDHVNNYGYLGDNLVKIDYGNMEYATHILPPMSNSPLNIKNVPHEITSTCPLAKASQLAKIQE